jgi:hypothetical protein
MASTLSSTGSAAEPPKRAGRSDDGGWSSSMTAEIVGRVGADQCGRQRFGIVGQPHLEFRCLTDHVSVDRRETAGAPARVSTPNGL